VINELAALHKPAILIPLGTNASRGDQLLNAESFERRGFSVVLKEEQLNDRSLTEAVHKTYQNRQIYIDAMAAAGQNDAAARITQIILSVLK